MSLSDQLNDIIASFGGFGPMVWLSVSFCGILLAELLLLRSDSMRARQLLAGISLGAVIIAGLWAVLSPVRGSLFMNLLYLDNQAIFMQAVIALSGLFVLVYELVTRQHDDFRELRLEEGSLDIEKAKIPLEWYSLLIAMILGLFLMTVSVNLLSIYLSIELVSICSYLLTALTANRKASEGGIKYLLFGAVSSAIMLYGMSLLYGMTGTLNITADTFGPDLAAQDSAVVTVAILLTLGGLLFKLSGVPFHVWTPDAYEAAPVPVAAFFSVAPKAAGILVLMRIVTALPIQSYFGDVTAAVLQSPLAALALAGMFIGNLSALRQTDAKRLLAYSTIAHAGFLLVGVVALNQAGFEAVLFYAGTYLFISLAAFFLIDLLARSTGNDLTIKNFSGLGAQQPLLAVSLTVVMIALTGLPPTVGFTAKLLSFSALYESYQQSGNTWLLALFALGLLNALISLVYYLKIPFLLFFRPATTLPNQPQPLPAGAVFLAIVLTVPVVGLFLNPKPLLAFIAGW